MAVKGSDTANADRRIVTEDWFSFLGNENNTNIFAIIINTVIASSK